MRRMFVRGLDGASTQNAVDTFNFSRGLHPYTSNLDAHRCTGLGRRRCLPRALILLRKLGITRRRLMGLLRLPDWGSNGMWPIRPRNRRASNRYTAPRRTHGAYKRRHVRGIPMRVMRQGMISSGYIGATRSCSEGSRSRSGRPKIAILVEESTHCARTPRLGGKEFRTTSRAQLVGLLQ